MSTYTEVLQSTIIFELPVLKKNTKNTLLTIPIYCWFVIRELRHIKSHMADQSSAQTMPILTSTGHYYVPIPGTNECY